MPFKQKEFFMESVIKESQGLKRQLELKIPSVAVDRSFLKSYQQAQKKAKISGFRQGKVPLNIIKENYKDQVFKDVLDDLFKEHYPSAIQKNSLNPVSSPSLIDVKLEEGQEAQILMEVEVHPHVKVENYLDLELEKSKSLVSQKDIDDTLERIQLSCKFFEEDKSYEGPSKKGDCLSVSLRIFNSEGKQVLEIKEQTLEELGQDMFLSGFDDKLLGLKKGEEKEFLFSFPVPFLKHYKVSVLEPQNLTTKLKILAFQVKKLPPIDDDLAQRFKVKTLKELREKVEEDLKKNTDQKSQEALENSLLEKLVEKNPLELPLTLLEDQKQRLQENAKKHLQQYHVSPADQETYLKKHDKEFETEARFSLHVSYLVEQLLQDLKIHLSDEDKEKSLKESFPNKSPKEMEENLKKSHHWEQFLFHLKRKKLISYLLEKSKITERIDPANEQA